MLLILLYLLGALSLSFLCSVLEAVLLSTPISFITMKEKEGNKTAVRLKEYKSNIDKPVAAILSLNTIAHTIGAAGVGSESVKVFGQEYFGIISTILTLLILVLSEIIPKTIGATYWRRLCIPATRVIHTLILITYPLVVLSEVITKIFSSKEHQVSISREEVSAMVNVGTEEGVFKAKESSIIQNFLKLEKIIAKEIMTPSLVVAIAHENMTMQELFENKQYNNYSRIPLYNENDEIITGYILRSCVLSKISKDNFNEPLKTIIRPILYFNENDSVSYIWEKLIENKEHISVIQDDYGCMRGIVTMEDVIETMLGVEIVDENDKAIDMQEFAKKTSESYRKTARIIKGEK